MKVSMIGCALVAGLAASTHAAVVSMTLISTIDTSSTSINTNANFVGSNVSSVAWNGTDLFVAGYNASGTVANTGMAKLSNALGASSWSSTFGALSTSSSRGFTGIAVKGNTIAAGWDGGVASVNSVRAFDAVSLTQTWATGGGTPDSSRRATGGANFDPGFNGAGTNIGVSYITAGSGRRHLMNTATGNYINGQNAGGIMTFQPGATTNWRGHAFDTATGDLYTRESNRVGKAVRSGDNTFVGSASNSIYQSITATAVDNQNIAFASTSMFGNLLFFNDRSTAAIGQSFSSVIKVMGTDGTLHTLDLGTFSAANGNGAYSFSFDAASQTLAVSDFANRAVYIFAVPTPGTLGLALAGGLLAARRRR